MSKIAIFKTPICELPCYNFTKMFGYGTLAQLQWGYQTVKLSDDILNTFSRFEFDTSSETDEQNCDKICRGCTHVRAVKMKVSEFVV